jgi:hypothetical protein
MDYYHSDGTWATQFEHIVLTTRMGTEILTEPCVYIMRIVVKSLLGHLFSEWVVPRALSCFSGHSALVHQCRGCSHMGLLQDL